MAGESDSLFDNLPAPYRGLPPSQHIDDRRQQPMDYATWMKHAAASFDPQFSNSAYSPTALGGSSPNPQQASLSPPHPGYGFGANMSQAPADSLPYIGSHLPIAPGDPGWTPPPSLSGPHSPGGDDPRVGYGRQFQPVDRFTPDQMQNAFQLWQTGQ